MEYLHQRLDLGVRDIWEIGNPLSSLSKVG